MGRNYEYIDNSYASLSQLLNILWIRRYSLMQKVLFDNGSEFKWDFNPLLKYSDTEPVCTTVNNLQANVPEKWVHQVIYSMLVTKDLDKKTYLTIYLYGVKP